MKINVINKSGFDLPKFETDGAAGVDLRASETVLIPSKGTVLVPTGLFVEIPQGFELQIRPRSGMSLKTKLRVANAPGTIDSDYRGEIKVIMDNIGEESVAIASGERVAQAVLCPVSQFSWVEKNNLSETGRGEGGFGSTGNI